MSNLGKISIDGIDTAESAVDACNWARVCAAVPVEAACRAIGLALLGFTLAACVTTETSDRKSRHTKETALLLSEAAMAGTIADYCPDKFDVGQNALADVLTEAKGIRDASPDSALTMSAADFKRYSVVFFDSFVSRRGIQESKPATWCAAGKAEVAAKSQIGKLLILR